MQGADRRRGISSRSCQFTVRISNNFFFHRVDCRKEEQQRHCHCQVCLKLIGGGHLRFTFQTPPSCSYRPFSLLTVKARDDARNLQFSVVFRLLRKELDVWHFVCSVRAPHTRQRNYETRIFDRILVASSRKARRQIDETFPMETNSNAAYRVRLLLT